MPQFLVTTLDNPFSPFTQFDEWFAFDTEKGYNTSQYLGRIAKTSYELSDQDNEQAINDAVDEIIRLNIRGIYRKVVYEPTDEPEDEDDKTIE